jgi:hypothetical protein
MATKDFSGQAGPGQPRPDRRTGDWSVAEGLVRQAREPTIAFAAKDSLGVGASHDRLVDNAISTWKG